MTADTLPKCSLATLPTELLTTILILAAGEPGQHDFYTLAAVSGTCKTLRAYLNPSSPFWRILHNELYDDPSRAPVPVYMKEPTRPDLPWVEYPPFIRTALRAVSFLGVSVLPIFPHERQHQPTTSSVGNVPAPRWDWKQRVLDRYVALAWALSDRPESLACNVLAHDALLSMAQELPPNGHASRNAPLLVAVAAGRWRDWLLEPESARTRLHSILHLLGHDEARKSIRRYAAEGPCQWSVVVALLSGHKVDWAMVYTALVRFDTTQGDGTSGHEQPLVDDTLASLRAPHRLAPPEHGGGWDWACLTGKKLRFSMYAIRSRFTYTVETSPVSVWYTVDDVVEAFKEFASHWQPKELALLCDTARAFIEDNNGAPSELASAYPPLYFSAPCATQNGLYPTFDVGVVRMVPNGEEGLPTIQWHLKTISVPPATAVYTHSLAEPGSWVVAVQIGAPGSALGAFGQVRRPKMPTPNPYFEIDALLWLRPVG